MSNHLIKFPLRFNIIDFTIWKITDADPYSTLCNYNLFSLSAYAYSHSIITKLQCSTSDILCFFCSFEFYIFTIFQTFCSGQAFHMTEDFAFLRLQSIIFLLMSTFLFIHLLKICPVISSNILFLSLALYSGFPLFL